MQDIALLVAPDFKDDGIEPVTHPTDGQKLLRNVGSPIEPIRLGEQLPHLLESYAAPGFALRRRLFRGSKLKRI
jgi:hypothetical protein